MRYSTNMKPRHKVIPASYLFLVKNKKILLLRRANTGYEDGNWSVPAGHLDGDEAATTAMVREAKEEIGLDIQASKLELAHIMHRRGLPGEGLDNERVDFFFVIQDWQGEPSNLEPHKCDGLEWFPLNKLPANTVACVRQAILAYQENRVFSEFGW